MLNLTGAGFSTIVIFLERFSILNGQLLKYVFMDLYLQPF